MSRLVRSIIAIWLLAAPVAGAAEIVIYGFEGTAEGWGIPDWAKTSADYVSSKTEVTQKIAQEGQSALEMAADFPGERWTGVYVEKTLETIDWTPFGRLVASVYVPPDAPMGLEARIILTVGDKWTWTEMNRAIPLTPGKWTEIAVNLKPGSMDWKFFPDEDFRSSVRKIGVRVESNKQPVYRGSVFLDNVRLSE